MTKDSCRTIQSGKIDDNPYMEGLREIRVLVCLHA